MEDELKSLTATMDCLVLIGCAPTTTILNKLITKSLSKKNLIIEINP